MALVNELGWYIGINCVRFQVSMVLVTGLQREGVSQCNHVWVCLFYCDQSECHTVIVLLLVFVGLQWAEAKLK